MGKILVIIYVLAAMFINTLPAQIFPSDTLFANDSISTFYDTYPTEEDSISSVYVPKVIFTPDDDFHNDSINIISGEIVVVTLPDTDEKLHSPHRASMFSAIIPGVGQIYNKKYWKIPILFGGIGGVAYAISFNSERYSYYRGAYRDFIIRDPANKSYLEIIEGTVITEERIYGDAQQWFRDYLNNSKNRFKRYRDISYAGMVFVYVINIIDASIDAHFYYFDVSDDLSFTIEPAYFHFNGDIGGAFGLSLKLNF